MPRVLESRFGRAAAISADDSEGRTRPAETGVVLPPTRLHHRERFKSAQGRDKSTVQDRPSSAQPLRGAAAAAADEAERARTPRTPFLALAGVWGTIAVTVAVLIAVALVLYYVTGGH